MPKRGINGAVLRAIGAPDHTVRVTRVEDITSYFRRIWFESETLFNDYDPIPSNWLRFWFPDPQNPDVEQQRAYTALHADPDTGTFCCDFIMHQPGGPASLWAENAAPGDEVEVTISGSPRLPVNLAEPEGYLLMGDATAIPAMNAIVEALPDTMPIEMYVGHITDEERDIPLAQHPHLNLHLMDIEDSSTLAQAIEDRDWSNWYGWAGAEVDSTKTTRIRLRDEFGFPKTDMYIHAYWVEGRSMGKTKDKKETQAAKKSAASDAFIPSPDTKKAAAERRSNWRSQAGAKLLAPLKGKLIVAGLIQFFITLLELAPFVLLIELSRQLLQNAPVEKLWNLGFWALGIMGLSALLTALLTLWLHWVDAGFAHGLRKQLLAKLSRLPLGWFTARTSGVIKQHVQDDPLALHHLVTHFIPQAVAAVLAPIAVLIYLLTVDVRMTLLLFVPILIFLITMSLVVTQSATETRTTLKWIETMNSSAEEYLANQPAVRLFGGRVGSSYVSKLRRYIDYLLDIQRRQMDKKNLMDFATRPETFLLLILLVGTLRVISGSLHPVDLLPFLLLGTTFGAKLLGIGYGTSDIMMGTKAATRIQAVLDEQELKAATVDDGADRYDGPGLVEFQNVTFGYRAGTPVVKDISLTLQPGTVTALVGSSGSGKSTLASLLARFYDISTGTIRIDGQDISELSQSALYARVGFVFQNTQLIRGSVRDNIALARPTASDEEIIAAAQAAQIHDRIMELPHGYDTVFGAESGFSGGEKQRVTIARALLAYTPVIILDEATAFADPESEYEVQQAINALSHNRTVLVIAHRLHTITDVNQIVVLDDGAIVEQGTHQALLDQAGRYRALWDAHNAALAR